MADKSLHHTPRSATRKKIARVKRLLVETDMTVQQIADEVGLHMSSIYRHLPAVRSRFGPPPVQPQAWRAEARELLLAGELTPAEIAERVGKSISTLYMFVPVRELRKIAAQNTQKKEKNS